MTETNPCKKKSWLKMNFRSLKLSLKFRPELLKLILKMRQCILKRNTILKSLKHRLKQLVNISSKLWSFHCTNPSPINDLTIVNEHLLSRHTTLLMLLVNLSFQYVLQEANANDKSTEQPTTTNPLALIVSANTETKKLQDSSTQTKSDNDKDQLTKNELLKVEIPKLDPPLNITNEIAGWNVAENGNTEKSIAEQVKEAAQSALQDTGMVYVESAGMYYDYKTGYYYNSVSRNRINKYLFSFICHSIEIVKDGLKHSRGFKWLVLVCQTKWRSISIYLSLACYVVMAGPLTKVIHYSVLKIQTVNLTA